MQKTNVQKIYIYDDRIPAPFIYTLLLVLMQRHILFGELSFVALKITSDDNKFIDITINWNLDLSKYVICLLFIIQIDSLHIKCGIFNHTMNM